MKSVKVPPMSKPMRQREVMPRSLPSLGAELSGDRVRRYGLGRGALRSMRASASRFVMPGLDPGIHVPARRTCVTMDPRIKSGGDDVVRRESAIGTDHLVRSGRCCRGYGGGSSASVPILSI